MGLMKKLTSALVASSLVLSLVGTAAAAYTPGAGEAAGQRMQDLKIIQGRPGEGLALNSEITRAELVTTIVRAFGQEENAQYLKGSTIFPDIANHWASGNIAMAVALVEKAGGDAIGMPDGTFAPDVKLTPAQAVAFLMKFVGLKADANKAWPNNFLDVAVEKGLITAEDKALIAAETGNATRGLTFYLFDNAFYNYKLADGETFYTKYVSPNGPTLTLTDLAETTMDSKVTVTGNAKDAYEVYVGSQKVTVDASGNFSAEVALPEVKDEAYTITVTAIDRAGNRVEKSDSIARVVGTIATVEAAAITVAAGATVDVAVAVKDEAGNVIADAAVTGTSSVGTFADGKFTASTTAGTGTLTLKAGEKTADVKVTITAGPLAKVVADKTSVNKGDIVNLTATDEHGNTVSGATFTQTSADAILDFNTGKFSAQKAGNYTVTATAGGATATITIGVFGSASKLAISAPEQIVANGSTKYEVTVTAVDSNGNVVTTDDTTEVTLNAPGLNVFDKDGNNADADSDLEKTLVDGSYTFKVSAPAGWAGQIMDITATDTTTGRATADLLTEKETTTELIGQVATAVKVSTTSDYLTANSQSDAADFLTVKVVDQKGVKMATGTYEAKVAVTGPARIESPTSATTFGTSYTWTVTSGEAKIDVRNQQGVTGTATFTATVDGVGTASKDVTSAFAGVAKQVKLSYVKASDTTVAVTDAVKAGTRVRVQVEVTDANGVPVDYDGTLTITEVKNDDDVEILATTAALTDANLTSVTVTDGSGEFDVVTTGAFTGTYEIKLDNADVDAVTAAVSVKAADYTHISFTRGQQTIAVPVGNATTNLTAQLYDAFGNKTAVSGVKLTFKGFADDGSPDRANDATSSAVTLNGTAKEIEVETDANGAATVTAAVRPYDSTGVLGDYYVTVSGKNADDDALVARQNSSSQDLDIVFVDAAAQTASNITVSFLRGAYSTVNAAPVTSFYLKNAGDTWTNKMIVKAVVKDNYGQLLDGEEANLKLVADEAVLWDGDELVAAADYTAPTWYGYGDTVPAEMAGITPGHGEYYAVVDLGKAGLVTLGVKDTAGATDVTATKGILVYAAAPTKAIVTEANSDNEIQVKANTVAGPFTLQLTDDYGNNTTSNVKKSVSVSGIDVRLSAGDVSVSTLETYNNVKFYVTTTQTTDFTVTFGDDVTGSVEIDVVE